MLIVALVLAVIGLAALVTAVVTSNELVAWVCIGASGLGVLLLIVDAIRERAQRRVPVALPSPATGEVGAVVAAAETEIIEPAAASVGNPVETLMPSSEVMVGGEASCQAAKTRMQARLASKG